MIRKIIIFIVLLMILVSPVYAEEIIASSDSEDDISEYEKYLPPELNEVLEMYGINTPDKIEVAYIFKLVFGFISGALNAFSDKLLNLVLCLVILSVLRRIIDNSALLLSVNVISFAYIGIFSVEVLSTLGTSLSKMLDSDIALISALAPMFAAIKLSGGAASSAVGGTYSFGIIIAVLELFIFFPMRTVLGFVCALFITERLSPVIAEMKLVKRLKKHITVCITFICTVLTTVLSIQNVLNARADSVAVRGVRFAASSFIPIIGGALGESIKTVSYGLGYVKSTVGALATLGVFVSIFPTIILFYVTKLLISLVSVLAQGLGCEKESAFLGELCEIIDVFIAISVCSFVLSFLLTYLFTVYAF